MKSDLWKQGQPEKTLFDKWNHICAFLEEKENGVVAFSGGVDSSVLCVAAHYTLGDSMAAMTISSEVNNEEDVPLTRTIAQEFGFKHLVFSFDDLENEEFVSNPVDRCYHCKRRRMAFLKGKAKEVGFDHIFDGSNSDDLMDYRPGLQANHELSVLSPLAISQLNKADIRKLAYYLGLGNWNRPSQPCMATRFPYNQRINLEKVQMVLRAERFLKTKGYEPVRVRMVDQDTVRLEINPEMFGRLIDDNSVILGYFKTLGLTYITLDLSGFQSGSMNEVLER